MTEGRLALLETGERPQMTDDLLKVARATGRRLEFFLRTVTVRLQTQGNELQ